jgi:hypothetical protein
MAWSAMWGAPSHSFWPDWGWLIVLLIIGFVAVSVGDQFVERTSRSLISSILGLLDERGIGETDNVHWLRWEKSFLHASASGHLHGRPITVTLRYSYAQRFNYNWLEVDFACRSPWIFEITKRGAASRLMVPFEQQQVLTGDAVVDQHLALVAHDPAFNRWIIYPETRRKILSLIIGRNVTSLKADPNDPVLKLRLERFSLLSKGLVLENTPGILEDMEALANSLDQLDRTGRVARSTTSSGPDDADAEAATDVQGAIKQTYQSEKVLGAESQSVSGGVYDLPISSPSLEERLVGAILIVSGITLLSGIPGALVLSIAPQNQLLVWSVAFVPLLGLGTLVKGVITYRRWLRSDREFRAKILSSS